ncbi:MAG: hypothetical protein QM715_18595 [Nibricoccus sp.]
MIYDFDYREREKTASRMAYAYASRAGLNRPQPNRSHPPRFVGGELVHTADKVSLLGDADDSAFEEYRSPVVSQIRQHEREEAEKDFLEFAQAETGMELSDEEYRKLRKKYRQTMEQSRAIAERLKGVGIDPYRHDEYGLYIWWLHSKTLEALPKYRRICLLPYIAAMTRAPKLAALEYFIQRHPYSRFWTFTTGRRCTVNEIPERLDWLFYKLRELNKELSYRWGLQIVFRTTEFGTLEGDEQGNRFEGVQIKMESVACGTVEREEPGSIERNEKGEALYHPHAHCVIHCAGGYIKPDTWQRVIKFVHSYWHRDGEKIVWLADGVIRDARECCKYVTKPGDIVKLSDSELSAFYAVTANRRLVRPMGILADEIRARKESGRILRRQRLGSRMQWAERLNHNRLDMQTPGEKEALENLQDAYALTEECKRLANLEPDIGGRLLSGSFAVNCRSVEVTKVMARIGPAAGPTPFKEPRVIVMTNRATPDMSAVTGHPLVFRLWAQTVAEWEAGRSASALIKVHTGTLTGEEFQGDLLGIDPPPDYEKRFAPFLETAPAILN